MILVANLLESLVCWINSSCPSLKEYIKKEGLFKTTGKVIGPQVHRIQQCEASSWCEEGSLMPVAAPR